ncbi:MAG: hypothetical protein JXA14_19750 [Anaerolineae bacterium]|nr:hypothetical protein [Anaerolineae bacterium]
MERRKIALLFGSVVVVALACVPTPGMGLPPGPVETAVGGAPTAVATKALPPGTKAPPPPSGPLIQPSDLAYLGAFRLPSDAPDEIGWMWSGEALTYYPEGDPGGPDDGFPGSLFGAGHNWNQYVSEISIPVPVVSSGKNVEELNTAITLQPFQDIRGGTIDWPLEQPRAGLEYLPPQGEQDSGKLYFCWAQHLDEGATSPSHGWAELDLSDPHPAGPWRIGEYWNYVTTDYLFAIPPEWADAYTPGMLLATGRYRDGGQGSFGPSLFAYGPWNESNPPQPGATLDAVPLLLYGNVYEEGSSAMDGYAHSDHWSGGAWLTAGEKSAVVFVGTKGLGETWYGCPDGAVWPEEPPYPPECEGRGWWSSQFAAQIIFYNPADLAAVAAGTMESGEPQPYAVMEIEDVLYNVDFVLLNHLGAAAFDRQRGLLYVLEPLADEDRSIVHVWRVAG